MKLWKRAILLLISILVSCLAGEVLSVQLTQIILCMSELIHIHQDFSKNIMHLKLDLHYLPCTLNNAPGEHLVFCLPRAFFSSGLMQPIVCQRRRWIHQAHMQLIYFM